MYPDNTCVEIRSDLVIEQVEDDALVLDMSGNTYFSLNPVALEMMTRLQAGATLAEVACAIGEAFDAPVDHIRRDLEIFIQALLTRNLASVQP